MFIDLTILGSIDNSSKISKSEYSILEFGRNCYENVAYFNFETNPKLNETFAENISPDYLIPILSHIAGQTIIREKTLIVFDEVQLCERALHFALFGGRKCVLERSLCGA